MWRGPPTVRVSQRAASVMERQRRAGAVRRSLLTTVRAFAIGAGTMRSYGDGVLDGVRIERFDGPRAEVRWLFQIAEDSEENRDGYIDDGDVLVAVLDKRPVGVLQITETAVSDELEINVLAVDDELPAPRDRSGAGGGLLDGSSRAGMHPGPGVDRRRRRRQLALLSALRLPDAGDRT